MTLAHEALARRIAQPAPKKMLAIDGGGIRGVLSLGVLQRIESLLKEKSGKSDFRLADYFDYIAGTSTGGIIAAGLSKGMLVGEILKFYREAGPQMFVKTNLLNRLKYKYDEEPLAKKLKDEFGETTEFGSPDLKTLLLLVMRNASTDSPWPLSNNPYAKYNDSAGTTTISSSRSGSSCERAPRHRCIFRRKYLCCGTRTRRRSSFSSMAASRCTTIRRSRCF